MVKIVIMVVVAVLGKLSMTRRQCLQCFFSGNFQAVEVKSSVPTLLSSNQTHHHQSPAGSSVTLECLVLNIGHHVVVWRQRDRIISVGNLMVRKGGKVSVIRGHDLVITDIGMEDAGEYICEVDMFGEVSEVRHELIVFGKLSLS